MSDYEILVGSTSQRIPVWLADSSSTTGAGLTGLAFNTASLTCYAHREDDGNAAGVQISLVTATRGTYASGGFIEKDATNMPGEYELGLPTATLAAGSKWVQIEFKGATNLAPRTITIRLTAVNPDSATAFMTSVATVTTVTNQLTAAQIATGVWQDATAGDFTTASSIGKSLYTSGVVPGGTNGLFIAGTNAATTITTALTTTFTGNLTGSVASVSGAVGSVTGNVGGNVSGSVASVTAGVTLSATGSVALTESYAADGAAATLPQLLYMTLALLSEFSISSTTLTAKKLDGSTTAGTFTLDSATAPTSITRAS